MLGCSARIADDAGLTSPFIQFIFPPPDPLRDYVASFWVLVSRSHVLAAALEHAFPSLGAKLIFNLGAPLRSASTALEPASAFSTPPRAYLLGARTTSVDLILTPSTMLIGVQFTPAGAYPFVQSSLRELTNRGVALDMVWPDLIALDERLAAAATMQQQVILLAQLLTKQLERKPDRQSVAQQVIALLDTLPDHRSIDQIAACLGISRRHLARLFLIQVGMPPKLCARILRFQQALRQLAQHPHMPATHIAALGVLLAGWHLPLALAEPSITLPYLLATVLSAVMTNWVYYNARQSALLAIVYHTAANTMGLYFAPMLAGPDLTRYFWLLAAVNGMVAVVVVLVAGPNLQRQPTTQVEPTLVGSALT